jgi:hypothetical protein
MEPFKGITQARYNKWASAQRHEYRRDDLVEELYTTDVRRFSSLSVYAGVRMDIPLGTAWILVGHAKGTTTGKRGNYHIRGSK